MANFILIFIFYSFLGWAIESFFRSVVEKGRPVNSGFLAGPFIPVYGFGALIIDLLGDLVSGFSFFLQLIIFTVFATILEYLTSVLLEKIFGMKLWDYSDYPINDKFHISLPLNINGRVCFLFSLFWAGLIAVQIFYLHPFITGVLDSISYGIQTVIINTFLLYLSIDLYFSARLYYRFSRFLSSIKSMQVRRISSELQLRLTSLYPTLKMRSFLRPLQAFPHLRDQLAKAWRKFPGISKIPYVQEIKIMIGEKLPLLFSKKKTANLKEFYQLSNEIIHHSEYQRLKGIKHHDKDIYTHNLSVAWISFLLAKKFHLRVREVVKGALLHDFFFYDWRNFRDRDYLLPHGFTHPVISYKNAVKVFGNLTLREKDIILKHMWPLTFIPPRYIESFLVSLVDKTIASKEAVKAVFPGRKELKRTGENIS